MYTTKYFHDEKFKDTIKKNSCRLRQKSSVQIGVYMIGQPKEQPLIQNRNENKENLNKNKTLERNKTPKNKLLNFIKTKNYKKIQPKDSNIEEKQILVKKKINEECKSSIKQRILSKLKEERNEKLNNIVKNENNNELSRTIATKAVPKDILVNRKKFVGSADIKNIIYRNRKENKTLSCTINKEENMEKNENNKNINNNNDSNNININKSNTTEKLGIYNLKNINNSKRFSSSHLEEKYSSFFFKDKNFKKENDIRFNNKHNNRNSNNDINKYNNNENNNKTKIESKNEYNNENNKNDENISGEHITNKILMKNYRNRNKKKNFTNNFENSKKYIIENLKNNKINNNNENQDKNDNKKNKNNKDIIRENKSNNKEDKNNNDYKNNNENKDNKENKNNNEKENNEKNNNEAILVHKRFKYKFIKKNEEEKSKNSNDEIKKNIILNKTSTKPEKKLTYFKETISKKFSATHTKKNLKDIHESLKLSVNKSPSDFEYEYNLTTVGEQNEDKNYYLSTEKPKNFSKSKYFKNLFIKTGGNEEFNQYNEDDEKKRNSILRNHLKYRIRDKKEKNNLSNNINISNNSNLSNKERGGGITELLKSDKKTYFEKKIKINNITNYNIYNYDYVMKMINEAIQLKSSIEIQSLYSILVINFNNKYLFTFDYKDFPKDIPQFSDCYKYYCIITIPLIFLHKDEIIYKNSSSEAKTIFEKFIYKTIENIGLKNMSFKKIDSFINEYKKDNNDYSNDKMTMEEYCRELINLIFKNYKEYSPLKKATEQLLIMAKKETIEKLINTINDTILYCFNHKQKNSFFLLDNRITGNKNKSFYKLNQLSNKDLNKSISTPTTPFIRCAMKKNFCLVLDIDETIAHSMKLPFGSYFLLRPGVINFLEELSKLYEIIIFTSSPKFYADGILNKIDIDNNYISHRLYKDHVVFEKGKSVKKLNMIGRDLNKIIFVDNMKSNAKYNLQNLCHVSSWIYDIYDEEIIKLKLKLKYIATNSKYKDDIRKGLECSL